MNNTNQDSTRRRFIKTLTNQGAALFLNPLTSWSMCELDPKVQSIVAKTIGIDTHNHMDVPFDSEEFKGQTYDLASELKSSGLTAICMNFCVDRPKLEKEGEAYERFLSRLNAMNQMLNANQLSRALTYSDLRKARQENKPIIIQSVEGGHFI